MIGLPEDRDCGPHDALPGLFQATAFTNQNVLLPSETLDTVMPLRSRRVMLSRRSSLPRRILAEQFRQHYQCLPAGRPGDEPNPIYPGIRRQITIACNSHHGAGGFFGGDSPGCKQRRIQQLAVGAVQQTEHPLFLVLTARLDKSVLQPVVVARLPMPAGHLLQEVDPSLLKLLFRSTSQYEIILDFRLAARKVHRPNVRFELEVDTALEREKGVIEREAGLVSHYCRAELVLTIAYGFKVDLVLCYCGCLKGVPPLAEQASPVA